MASLEDIIRDVSDAFVPYCDHCEASDSLTFYFRGDADYSKRLTDHVTLYLSLDDDSLVGCRIKGVKGILDDLPNYIEANYGNSKLLLLFWSFRGSVKNESERQLINKLAQEAKRIPAACALS